MRSSHVRLVQALSSATMLIALLAPLSACGSLPPVYLNAEDCSKLIPKGWKDGVPSASLPADKSVGEWAAFGDAQTGQLDTANGRTADAIEIVQTCEAIQKAAADSLKPKAWWHFW